MRRVFLFLLVCYLSQCLLAVPTVSQKTYGGAGDDVGVAFCWTPDGGIVVAGYTNSTSDDTLEASDNFDFWIMKLDAALNPVWEKTFGGSGRDMAVGITAVGDSDYLVAGLTESDDGQVSGNNGLSDYWVIRLDSNGSMIWQRCFGGPGHESASTILKTSDNEFLVTGNIVDTGQVNSLRWGDDIWLLRIDGSGNLLSEKTVGDETSNELLRKVIDTGAEDLIATGFKAYKDTDISCNYINEQLYVSRFGYGGDPVWEKEFGGRFSESGFDIVGLSEGTFLVVGSQDSGISMFSSGFGGKDFWVVKIDGSGNELWSRTYGGSATDVLFGVTELENGEIMVAGHTTSKDRLIEDSNGMSDTWLSTIDCSGNILWSETFGGPGDDVLLALDSSGNSVIGVGYSTSSDGDITENNGNKDLLIVSVVY